MKEVSKTGHFTIDLPSSDAATALSGPGNSFLKKFESLTGVSLTIRGLQLEMNGVISKIGHFTIDLPNSDAATALSGPGNSFLKKFESLTGVSLTIRGLQLELNGVMSKLERASALVELTRPIWEQGLEVPEVDLKAALSSLNMGESSSHAQLGKKVLARSREGRYLRPRTIRQKEYVESIENYDLTFAIGPAGTGKTFLATVCAARLLNEKKIEKIV